MNEAEAFARIFEEMSRPETCTLGYNSLRFDDEFVRHKILDVIGDMALVGHPLIGHLVAHRGGHALHTEFAAMVLQESDAWTLVEVPLDAPVQAPAGALKDVRAVN